MESPKQRGGKRPNAGRKTKWGEKTVTISVRVPISKAEALTELIDQFLNKNKVTVYEESTIDLSNATFIIENAKGPN